MNVKIDIIYFAKNLKIITYGKYTNPSGFFGRMCI